ncbi:MAG: toll/interleukin-1 receptor domain-containing protein [Thermoanaerobaculia bacterium]
MNVFLSHAVKDRELARDVAAALASAGLTVWDPASEILPGDNWAEKIGRALEESEAMVVLLTPEALASDSIRRDVEYALGNPRFKERLIPVLSGSLDSPSGEGIPWILKRLKTVTLTEDDPSSLGRIAEVLRQAA